LGVPEVPPLQGAPNAGSFIFAPKLRVVCARPDSLANKFCLIMELILDMELG